MRGVCSVTIACDAPELSRGMCRKHYQRWWKHKDPFYMPLPNRRLVSVSKQLYLRCRLKGKEKYVHRIVWTEWHGPIPSGYVVHHKNGDTWDNCLENLQLMPAGEHARICKRHKGP